MNASSRRVSFGRIAQGLLIVAAMSLLIVFVRSRPKPSAPPAEDPWRPPLRRGEGASVTVVDLDRSDGGLRLEREDGRWMLVEPLLDLASPRMVGELFRALESLEIARRIDSDSLARYGLDPPWAVLTLELRDGRSLVMRVGDTAPASDDTYACWDGLPGIALVPRFVIVRFFMNEIFAWREAEILPPESAAIDSVWITWPMERARLQRSGPEKWRMLEPSDREADGLACERAVAMFWRFQYVRFLDDRAGWSGLGLDEPAATWIVFRDRAADTVRVGRVLDAGGMVVRTNHRSPGEAPASLYDLLASGLAPLEVRTFFTGRPANVSAVLVQEGEAHRVYVRAANGWRVGTLPFGALAAAENGAFPDTALMRDRRLVESRFDGDLQNLFWLRGEEWLPPLPAEPRGTDFRLRIQLWTGDGRRQWAFFRATSPGIPWSGVGVGSRAPRRPMRLSGDTLDRWRLLSGIKADTPLGR